MRGPHFPWRGCTRGLIEIYDITVIIFLVTEKSTKIVSNDLSILTIVHICFLNENFVILYRPTRKYLIHDRSSEDRLEINVLLNLPVYNISFIEILSRKMHHTVRIVRTAIS